jgi:hypothetical protein
MNTYLITFTLKLAEGRNPDCLLLAIQAQVDPYAKELSPFTWLVRTNVDAEGILSLLRDQLVPGDKLAVILLPVGVKFASEGLAEHEKQYLIITP